MLKKNVGGYHAVFKGMPCRNAISITHMLPVAVQRGPARGHSLHRLSSAYKNRPKTARRPPARAGVPYAVRSAAAPFVGWLDSEAVPELDGELPPVEVRLAPAEPEALALLPPALAPSVVRLPHCDSRVVTQLRCWAASLPLAEMQASYQKFWHMSPATDCWYLARPEVMSVPLEHLQLFSSVVSSHVLPLLAIWPRPPQSSTHVFSLALHSEERSSAGIWLAGTVQQAMGVLLLFWADAKPAKAEAVAMRAT